MSPIQMVALAVRLFAIWLGLYSARAAPALYIETQKLDDPIAMGIVIAVALVIFAVVLLLWFFPRTVARSILPSTSEPAVQNTSPDTWLALGCSLLGLWLLAEMFPGLVRFIFVWYYSQRTKLDMPDNVTSGAVYYIAEFAVGVWLLLGASGARKLFWWVRNAGAR
jgi:hypothetical protein